jgi:hypothetical protein
MNKKRSKTEKLLDFLQTVEKENRLFYVSEAVKATGYKEASVTTYLGKRLLNFIVFVDKQGGYSVKGALNFDDASFKKHMTQKSGFVITNKRKIEDRLAEKSLDAFLLAIGIYNRPTQRNRIEAFCILMINAWELFLKAQICHKFGESKIYYSQNTNKALAITDVLKKIYTNQNDPVRKNIEVLIELRNKAVHLLLPEMQPRLSRVFQSSVLNFQRTYSEFTGRNPFEDCGTGLISMVIDSDEVGDSIIKKNYGDETALIISNFLTRLTESENRLNSTDFSIPIEYKLILSKNPKHGDLTLTIGKDGEAAILVKVPKDIDDTHPYREKDVLRLLKERLLSDRTNDINKRGFQSILFKEKIRTSKTNEYYFLVKNPETHRYSEALVDLIVEKVTGDSNYLTRCKESYSQHLKKQRESKR